MANTKLVFLGTDRSKTDNVELEAFSTTFNELFISINNSGEHFDQCKHICLDRETAIKLVKNLKLQISFLEVKNG